MPGLGSETGDPVKCRADVVLGVAGGYFLGRTKRMKLALIMGSLATVLRGRRPAHVPPTASVVTGIDDIAQARTPGDGLSKDGSSEDAPPDEGGFHDRAVGAPQQVRANRADDVDGSAVAETVAFGLDGRHYRLDLSRENATRLREALAPFVAVARLSRQGGRDRRGRSGRDGVQPSRSSGDRRRNAAIREWARQHGHELSKRGRIPASVLGMYKNDVG
jgi:Lsr2